MPSSRNDHDLPVDTAEHDDRFATRQFCRYDAVLPDHHPPRPAVTSVLHQEEALAARHDSRAEPGKVDIEGDVVFGSDLEGVDRPFSDLDFRHTCTLFAECSLPDPSGLTTFRGSVVEAAR
jgi:hypothetical protein